MSHSDLETLLEREGRELMRRLLQAHLDQRARARPAGPVVGAYGVARTHTRHGTRALETRADHQGRRDRAALAQHEPPGVASLGGAWGLFAGWRGVGLCGGGT